MEDHPTHPAVLATETVPVPLTSSAPLSTSEAPKSGAMGLVWKIVLAIAVAWLAKHWLFS
jgi:hypothetical protein